MFEFKNNALIRERLATRPLIVFSIMADTDDNMKLAGNSYFYFYLTNTNFVLGKQCF